jgi:hypothetical protein
MMSVLQCRAPILLAIVAIAGLLGGCAAPPTLSSRAPVPQHRAPTPVSPVADVIPPRLPSLNQLTGLHPTEIIALLGQPDLRRDEPPAQLWQYRAADCVLNLFFYRERGAYRLTRAETWDRSFAGSSSPGRCRDATAPVRAHLVSLRSSL